MQYSRDKLEAFKKRMKEYRVEYGYEEMFHYEKAMEGVFADSSVVSHAYSALDENGKLTKEHLFKIVKSNNKAYLENATSVIQALEDDVVLQICEIITDVTNHMLERYPDIDKDRVYCNLGNLKIVEKVSAINYGAVQADMVLHITRGTAKLLDAKADISMYNVIVHETMHILQFGCSCEQATGCDRRCGPAHYYEDWEQHYADWIWLGEGSAERMTCLYMGAQPMTYFNHINYILTFDLATVLKENVPANYIETLYFYNDADKLFQLFDAETEEKKQEIYKMIYSLEIMQSAPSDVQEAYQKNYGVEWTEEVSGDVFNKVKRPIIQAVTKRFYCNLVDAVMNHEVSKNDVLFLLNLYESTINQHLNFTNSKYDEYNAEFVQWYKACREEFFASFENLTAEEYTAFTAIDENNRINAAMRWLVPEKQEFLLEKSEAHGCQYKLQ